MPNTIDTEYLLTGQYQNSANLSARNDLHVRYGTNQHGWRPWVFDQILAAGLPADAEILEVGAGPAWLWADNLVRIPPGWTVTLSDFSVGMVAEARQTLAGCGRAFKFEIVDIQAIPFGDERFDCVIANHMLYHVPNRPAALEEVSRVLKPGGQFFAATNGVNHLRELDELGQQFAPSLDYWTGFSTQAFHLEDGEAQLAPFFSGIQVSRHPDGLAVTEAEPIVAYLLSGPARELFSDTQVEHLRRFVADKIAAEGALKITKDSGLFQATKSA